MTVLLAALLALGFQPAACPELPDAEPGLVCYQADGVTLGDVQAVVTGLAGVVEWDEQSLMPGAPTVVASAEPVIDGVALHVAFFPFTGVLVTLPR